MQDNDHTEQVSEEAETGQINAAAGTSGVTCPINCGAAEVSWLSPPARLYSARMGERQAQINLADCGGDLALDGFICLRFLDTRFAGNVHEEAAGRRHI
jgi:hypothetical protein